MKLAGSKQVDSIDINTKLTSIISLTDHKDYIPLTRAFLDEIKSILGVQQVNLYEVYGSDENKSTCDLLLKDVLDILSKPIAFYERINLHIHTTQSNDKDLENVLIDDIQQTVFPIQSSGSIQRTLVIDWLNLHPENWTYILSLLKVFNNLLKIIDEKDRDRLTGLLNRNTFDNNLENIINYSKQQSRKARNSNGHSWIAILDIDHFKQINDNHGHIMGDEVLLLFSRLLLSTFRYSDVVFRFGGEEFVAVLTGCNEQGAKVALNRFRKTIESYKFPQVGQVTVSAGYIRLDSSNAPNILLDRADQALYHAKKAGRNKVIYYNDVALALDKVEHVSDVELF